MSKIDNNYRYHPYYRRYDDDDNYKNQQYRRSTKHHYQNSSHRDNNRNSNNLSYRHSYKNDYHYQHPTTKSKNYSYFSSPPPPLMSANIHPPLPPLPPPPPPPPPPSLLSVVPHERESWIRSVKKTKLNESTEQKTQYLETMLRMPQQKSLLKSSKFDQMRFADDQLSNTLSSTTNSDNLEHNSFHLIGDIYNHDEICTLEEILFDKKQKSTTSNHQSLPSSSSSQSIIEPKKTLQQNCSGFLIDNCDDEEEHPPYSTPPRPLLPPLPLSSSTDELIQQNDDDINQQRVMLVNELDAADAERKQELKRQKRLNKKLQKKTKEKLLNSNKQQEQIEESLSDWIVEYDVNQISELTNEVQRVSITMTNEDKTEKVNLILMKIKKQQEELKKLRQYVISMLDEQDKPKSSKLNRQNSNKTQDLLLAFLNQPTQSGCWLCSGKMYAEVATQCDHDNKQ